MANPITWRNVQSNAGANPGYLMRSAQESFSSGFDALGNILEKRQQTNEANFNNRQQNLAADYFDRVAQARSVDDVAALRDNSQLQAMRQGLSADVRNQTRGALDDREAALIQQTNARQEFGDNQHNRGLRDKAQDIIAGAYAGDRGSIQAMNELDFRDNGEMVGQAWNAYTGSQDESRAQQGNARSWIGTRLAQASDARSAESHDLNKRAKQRGMEELDQRDQFDRIGAQFFQQLSQNNVDMTDTEMRRNLHAAYLDAGASLTEANKRAANFDLSRAARESISAVDQAAIDRQVLARESQETNNSVYQAGGYAEDPVAARNDLLSKFTDSEGRWFGQGDPEERIEYGAQLDKILGEGIPLGDDDKIRRLPPAHVEAIVQGVPRGAWYVPGHWGNTIEGAAQKYVDQNPGLLDEIDRYNQMLEDTSKLQRAGADSVRPKNGKSRLQLGDLTGR